jgi:predicted RNase H-like HicB family nuclease
MTYLAVIRMTVDEDFSVDLPDFPEVEERCASIPEAQRRARTAVHEALQRVEEQGRRPPEPTPKHELEQRPEYRSSFLVKVETDGASLGAD